MSESKSINAAQIAQSFTHFKDPRRRGRINIHMVQNVLLVWLDADIDENNDDFRNTIIHLRRTFNTIKTFTDGQECIHAVLGRGVR